MINSVQAQRRGQQFVDAEFVLGVEPRSGGLTTPWFGLDASGKDKAHTDAAGADRPSRRRGARALHGPPAIFDVDGDGDLDIVTNEFNAAPMVLISNLTEKTPVHYVAVKLIGTTSNRDGLGAVVKVTAGGSTYTKVYGRQLGIPVAQSLPALLRPGICRSRRQHRGDVAVGEETDRGRAGEDQHDAGNSGAIVTVLT